MTAVALALALALAAPACSTSRKLGLGEDVGFCQGWPEWEGLDEPQITDRTEVIRWAEGGRRIIKRIDLRVKIDRRKPPAAIKVLLKTVDRELLAYRDGVAKTRDTDGLRRLAANLAAGPFDAAADSLTQFGTRCTNSDRGT
jgi:hypothetical protein